MQRFNSSLKPKRATPTALEKSSKSKKHDISTEKWKHKNFLDDEENDRKNWTMKRRKQKEEIHKIAESKNKPKRKLTNFVPESTVINLEPKSHCRTGSGFKSALSRKTQSSAVLTASKLAKKTHSNLEKLTFKPIIVNTDFNDDLISEKRHSVLRYQDSLKLKSEVSKYATSTADSEGVLPSRASFAPRYTLVLDLDETLIHYISKDSEKHDKGHEDYYLMRPYAMKFIKQVSEFYEIVIFTAATQEYADPIIDDLDPDCLVAHRLYREHTLGEKDIYVKDLELIGRSLKSTLIVDNM